MDSEIAFSDDGYSRFNRVNYSASGNALEEGQYYLGNIVKDKRKRPYVDLIWMGWEDFDDGKKPDPMWKPVSVVFLDF